MSSMRAVMMKNMVGEVFTITNPKKKCWKTLRLLPEEGAVPSPEDPGFGGLRFRVSKARLCT